METHSGLVQWWTDLEADLRTCKSSVATGDLYHDKSASQALRDYKTEMLDYIDLQIQICKHKAHELTQKVPNKP